MPARTTLARLCAPAALGTLLTLAAPAIAQTPAPAETPPVPAKPRVTFLEFDPMGIEGNRHAPTVGVFLARSPSKHGSMVVLRRSFIPEILKSARHLSDD